MAVTFFAEQKHAPAGVFRSATPGCARPRGLAPPGAIQVGAPSGLEWSYDLRFSPINLLASKPPAPQLTITVSDSAKHPRPAYPRSNKFRCIRSPSRSHWMASSRTGGSIRRRLRAELCIDYAASPDPTLKQGGWWLRISNRNRLSAKPFPASRPKMLRPCPSLRAPTRSLGTRSQTERRARCASVRSRRKT